MRKPTPSEMRLLTVFAFLIFTFANILAAKWYLGARQSLVDQSFQLEQTATEYRALLAERPYWDSRREWMQQHPLSLHEGRAADSRFAEEIQKSLTKNGVSIDSQQLKDSVVEGGLVQTQLDLTLKGRLEQIIRWLHQVQRPGEHVAVQAFTLRQLDEGDSMLLRIRLAKIFRVKELTKTP